MSIAVIPDQARAVTYIAAGGETQLTVPFPFYAVSDIEVRRTVGGTTTVLSQPADYTVQGAGQQAGGTVTLAQPAIAGHRYTIVSAMPFSRTSAYTDGQALQAASLNGDVNRLWIALQQLREQHSRALRVPLTDPVSTLELPPVTQRAGRVLGFDASGQPVPLVPNPGNLVITPFGEQLIGAADAATGRAVMGAADAASLAAVEAALPGLLPRDGSQPMTGPLRLAAGAGGGAVFAGDTDTGIVRPDPDTVQVVTGGSQRLTVTNGVINAHVPLAVPPSSHPTHAVRRDELASLVPATDLRRVVTATHTTNASTTSTTFVSTGASISIQITETPRRLIVFGLIPAPKWEITFPTGSGGGGESAEFRWTSSLGNGPPSRLSGTFVGSGTWGAYGSVVVMHLASVSSPGTYIFTLQMRTTRHGDAGIFEVVETRANLSAIQMLVWELI